MPKVVKMPESRRVKEARQTLASQARQLREEAAAMAARGDKESGLWSVAAATAEELSKSADPLAALRQWAKRPQSKATISWL